MKRVPFALLALLGLAAAAAPAGADDFGFGAEFGGRDARWRDRTFGIGFDAHERRAPRPRYEPYPEPTPFPAPTREFGRRVFVPAHLERRTETVCQPAVYDTRRVPVYEERVIPVFRDVTVPTFENVRVPVYETRRVPIFQAVLGHHGHSIQIQIGERTERIQVGERTERVEVGTRVEHVRVGDRRERVQVGERTERVLVCAETCREVVTEVWIAGRYVTVLPRGFDRTRLAAPHDLGDADRFGPAGSDARREFTRPLPDGVRTRGTPPTEGATMDEDEVARVLREAAPRMPRR